LFQKGKAEVCEFETLSEFRTVEFSGVGWAQ
jgi:hypothetical protein